uniref:Uncharacterized protein n=1 Tax=Cacopsylla melanoneura TaxID=428564 RepID=A0A8D8Z067_9HEMI
MNLSTSLLLFVTTLLTTLLAKPLYRFTTRSNTLPDILLKDVTWENMEQKKYFYKHLAGLENSSEIAWHDAQPRGASMPPYFTGPKTKRFWRPTPVFDRWDFP